MKALKPRTKFLQIEPTPARGNFSELLFDDDNWWAEEKLDGDRRIAQFLGGSVRFTGRRIGKDGLYVEKTFNLPHLNGSLTLEQSAKWGVVMSAYNVDEYGHHNPSLDGTVLDGEIVVLGGRSKDVTSIMGSLPEEAIRKQLERGWVRYYVFDCLFWKGKDIRTKPLHYRRKRMLAALKLWSNTYAVKVPKKTKRESKTKHLQAVWSKGGEGIILKHRESLYGEHLRWVKVKKQETVDVVIMGYAPAKAVSTKVSGETSATKYAAKGWIGAIIFGLYKDGKLVECGQCSGMPDALREKLSRHGKRYVGTVMEIEAQEREPDTGAFRHPRFVRLRPDSNSKSQTWEKYQ